jgi:RimJ/RimL family protein N-acetyltransferase
MDLGDVVVRWVRPTDVEGLVDAAQASYAELHEWMPWASSLDALTVEAVSEFYERTEDERAEGRTFVYVITDATADRPLGTVGCHARIGPGGVEMGYWLHTEHVGRGLTSRAVAALTDVLLACEDVDHVEIHCDETNARSAAIPRRLGYELVDIRDRQPEAPGETGREMIWRRTTPIGEDSADSAQAGRSRTASA